MSYVGVEINKAFHFGSQTVKDIIHGNKHYHNLFELYYLESGRCSYFIEDKIYEMIPNDIVLIPAGIIHNAVYPPGPHTRMLINCSNDYIPKGISFDSLRFYRCGNTSKHIYKLMKNIEKEYLLGDNYSDDMLKCYTHELFIHIVRNNVPENNISQKKSLIEDVTKYIHDNFGSNISLSEIAEYFCVSTEHLSRSFKKHTGFGFNEYVNLIRLRKAEFMLKNETDKSILEIAFLCGFNDINYFSAKFHKIYGITPSAFRGKRGR